MRGVGFAKRVFIVAAIYGILALAPQYFTEEKLGRDFPPPITHPEHYYGFIGVALAWQFLFLVIAKDPVRFRAAMPVAVLEKLAFGIPAIALYLQGRIPAVVLGFGIIDLVLATFFILSYRATASGEG